MCTKKVQNKYSTEMYSIYIIIALITALQQGNSLLVLSLITQIISLMSFCSTLMNHSLTALR